MNQKINLKFWMSEIAQLDYLFEDTEISDIVANIMFRYFECECLFKKLFWPIAKAKNSKLKREQLKIPDTSKILSVFNDYSIKVDEEKIDQIFGGNDKNLNECSIKKIRDRLVHNATDYVVKAIVERKDEMMKDMDDFLNMIRSQSHN